MFSFSLHPGEQVQRIFRQTALILFKPALTAFILLFIPIWFSNRYDLWPDYKGLLYFWAILVLVYFLNKLALWSLNAYLITSRRVAVVIYSHLFSKQVLETPIERILNISFKKHGLWAALLNFGDVEVQIVGLVQPLVFHKVRGPEKIKDYLWELHIALSSAKNKDLDLQNISSLQQQIGYTKTQGETKFGP